MNTFIKTALIFIVFSCSFMLESWGEDNYSEPETVLQGQVSGGSSPELKGNLDGSGSQQADGQDQPENGKEGAGQDEEPSESDAIKHDFSKANWWKYQVSDQDEIRTVIVRSLPLGRENIVVAEKLFRDSSKELVRTEIIYSNGYQDVEECTIWSDAILGKVKELCDISEWDNDDMGKKKLYKIKRFRKYISARIDGHLYGEEE